MSQLATTPAQPDSLLLVIERAARDPGTDVAKMERLLGMAQEIRATEAKSAFNAAMSLAQGEMRPISKDCNNPQTRSRYASYQAIDEATRPIYTAHGFAMRFGSKASTIAEHVIVTCCVSHRQGHCEEHELDMPADGRGIQGKSAMTSTHATGSALTYGKRYLAGLIWNLSFGETDDDGNGASPRPQQRYSDRAGTEGHPEETPEPSREDRERAKKPDITEATEYKDAVVEAVKTPKSGQWADKLFFITFAGIGEAGTFDKGIATFCEARLKDNVKVNVKIQPNSRKPGTFEITGVEAATDLPI